MVPDRGSDNLRNIFIMILEKFLFRQYSMAGISKKSRGFENYEHR